MFCLDKIKVTYIGSADLNEKQLLEAIVRKFQSLGGNSDQIESVTVSFAHKESVVCHVWLTGDGPIVMNCLPCRFNASGYSILASKVITSL
jgi:hypothetical protein